MRDGPLRPDPGRDRRRGRPPGAGPHHDEDEQPGRRGHDRGAVPGVAGGGRDRPDRAGHLLPDARACRGMSENIRVRSLVGRYLEHSRIYRFANGLGAGHALHLIGLGRPDAPQPRPPGRGADAGHRRGAAGPPRRGARRSSCATTCWPGRSAPTAGGPGPRTAARSRPTRCCSRPRSIAPPGPSPARSSDRRAAGRPGLPRPSGWSARDSPRVGLASDHQLPCWPTRVTEAERVESSDSPRVGFGERPPAPLPADPDLRVPPIPGSPSGPCGRGRRRRWPGCSGPGSGPPPRVSRQVDDWLRQAARHQPGHPARVALVPEDVDHVAGAVVAPPRGVLETE